MTRAQRLREIAALIHDPATCSVCHGTGRDPTARKPYDGCSRCLVRSTRVSLTPRDLKWLLQQAGHA